MLEHGRRLGNAILLLTNKISPGSDAVRIASGALTAFSDGHARTQEYLSRHLDALAEVQHAPDS